MASPAPFRRPRGRSVASSELAGAADRSRERLAVPGQSYPLPAGSQDCEVLKLTIYVVNGQNIKDGFAATQKVWCNFPTAVSVLIIDGLAMLDALVEIEAIATIEAYPRQA